MCPPGSYLYETTDGRRVRIFWGKKRESTSSMISIGGALAPLHCVRWAWGVHEAQGGTKCPHNFAKSKLKAGVCLKAFRLLDELHIICLMTND